MNDRWAISAVAAYALICVPLCIAYRDWAVLAIVLSVVAFGFACVWTVRKTT